MRSVALAGLTLCACGGATPSTPGQAPAAATIRIDGSSTVYPISEAVAEEFRKEHDAHVAIGVSGTGGGFKKFCAGEIDISDASRPIKDSEKEVCAAHGIDYVQLQVAFDGISVVVNPANTFVDHLSTAELKTIWAPEAQDVVTRWNQVRPSFPDQPLALFGPGVDSGTFDYFTETIMGKAQSSRGDYTASEDDNVLVHGVATDPGALGFFGFAYYVENQASLRVVPILGEGGAPVAPSVGSIADGSYAPLSRPIFIYVSKQAAARSEVGAFVDFYLAHTAALAAEVGYIGLPPASQTEVLDRWKVR